MNITFQKIEAQNFKSIGPLTTLNYQDFTGLTYIYGENLDINDNTSTRNGTGKSTLMIDCLMFALFGQTLIETSVPFIANRYIDKKTKTFVKLYMNVDGIDYQIECYVKPSKTSVGFTIEKINKDGSVDDITPPSTIKAKKYIQENILKCNMDIFKSSIIISASDMVNFYNLPAAKKRSYIESVFSLNCFGDMYNNIKSDYNNIKKEISFIQNELIRLNNSLTDFTKKHDNYQSDMTNKAEDVKQKIVDKYNLLKSEQQKLSKLNNVDQQYSDISKQINDLQLEKQNTSNNIQKLNITCSKLESEIESAQKVITKIQSIQDGLCKDCTKLIDSKFNLSDYSNKISSNKNKIKKIKSTLKELDEQQNNLIDKLQNLNDQLFEINKMKISFNNTTYKVQTLTEEVDDLKNRYTKVINEINNNPFISTINDLNNQIDSNKLNYQQYDNDLIHLDILKDIASENGVKKIMIRDIVKLLNTLIQKYLSEIGSEYILIFDDNFDYKCITPGGECEFGNFSAGERQRIKIATIFAFRDLIINGKINSNILMIDELLDSFIDSTALKNIITILSKKVINHNQNVFIISHRTEALDENVFSHIIKVIKHNGVSQLEIK